MSSYARLALTCWCLPVATSTRTISFTYGLVLANLYHIPSDQVGFYFFPFALGNLLGPLTIGHLFDTVGRRPMILLTYCVSAILLAISGALFDAGMLDATTQTIFWSAIFFLASAGASSAYLTVSEIFPPVSCAYSASSGMVLLCAGPSVRRLMARSFRASLMRAF